METLTVPVTIHLTPEMKARLDEIAEERNLAPPECARELLVAAMRGSAAGGSLATGTLSGSKSPDPDRAARLAAIDSAAGSMAYLRRNPDEVARARQEELLHEEERDRRRHEGRAA